MNECNADDQILEEKLKCITLNLIETIDLVTFLFPFIDSFIFIPYFNFIPWFLSISFCFILFSSPSLHLIPIFIIISFLFLSFHFYYSSLFLSHLISTSSQDHSLLKITNMKNILLYHLFIYYFVIMIFLLIKPLY